ncbi:hypothetical protein [Crateriforma conspicua]|uniref:Uncharacterized protein n=1 Tax=Crateriforma conspicua TaxID=2527996 RepID=A0A5C5Y735_9PLAN|nr:hypothetical protein [Crateriforma conspicua]TWT70759.1 hypothetical protein Pan14r_30670 [Crateriforma conspicua]
MPSVSPSTLPPSFGSLPAIALATLLSSGWLPNDVADASDARPVQFDLHPVVAAHAVDPSDASVVQIQLKVSSIVPSIDDRPMDQWTLRLIPRNDRLVVRDYSPQTSGASHLDGSIDVKVTEEDSESFGLASVVSYGPASADAGVDNINKTIESRSFRELPQLRAITAAGTIRHGRGVYYQLRHDRQQILEGEKCFTVTYQVPNDWQAGLFDVFIEAKRQTRPFGRFETVERTVATQHFTVAAYRPENHVAKTWAYDLFHAEAELRNATTHWQQMRNRSSGFPAMLQSLASTMDHLANAPDGARHHDRDQWLDGLLQADVDPYTNPAVRRLPVDLRVLAIAYCDKRDELSTIETQPVVTQSSQAERLVSNQIDGASDQAN